MGRISVCEAAVGSVAESSAVMPGFPVSEFRTPRHGTPPPAAASLNQFPPAKIQAPPAAALSSLRPLTPSDNGQNRIRGCQPARASDPAESQKLLLSDNPLLLSSHRPAGWCAARF